MNVSTHDHRFPFLINSVAAASLGMSMNILLFFLITKQTPTVMRSYSRIMRVHCVSDVIYDTVCFITGLVSSDLSFKSTFFIIQLQSEATSSVSGRALLQRYPYKSITYCSAVGFGLYWQLLLCYRLISTIVIAPFVTIRTWARKLLRLWCSWPIL